IDCFLKPGQTVMSYLDLAQGAKPQDVDATVEYHDLPLAVLVDKETASMGEILAAAIQTHKRGLLVGQQTWGKGVGQTGRPIGDEGMLWLVERIYYYPGA